MASEYKNASDCNQNNVSSESDRNDSIICVEDSGKNQMEVEQKSKTDQNKNINEHSIVVDKGSTREIIQNVNRDERKSEEPGMAKTKKRRTQIVFFITDVASITPSVVSDEKSTKFISVKIENFNTNMVFLETLLKDFQIIALQEHWLYGFEKGKLIDFCEKHGFSLMIKSTDDNDPLTPLQRPRGKGGVAILRSKRLDQYVTTLVNDGGNHICAIQVESLQGSLTIINCYLP